MPTYLSPPILEAVIEFRFKNKVRETDIGKVIHKLKSKYPNQKTIFSDVNFDMEITEQGPKVKALKAFSKGKAVENTDANKAVKFFPHLITISRLAPYDSWDDFISDFDYIWDTVEKSIGSVNELERIGVRYINRIDIPKDPDTNLIHEDEYLTIGVRSPAINPLDGFELTMAHTSEGFGSIIKIGTIEPPLPTVFSLLLDIDVFQNNIKFKDRNDLMLKLSEFRNKKNEIFELCTTDKCRHIFDGVKK